MIRIDLEKILRSGYFWAIAVPAFTVLAIGIILGEPLAAFNPVVLVTGLYGFPFLILFGAGIVVKNVNHVIALVTMVAAYISYLFFIFKA
ncbi:hypothetical protein JXA85_01775, partial [Candidatus Woesearchaeota archaeon]|nr:hypothetical protein [Candidatus Woesearchaeota archaeon]